MIKLYIDFDGVILDTIDVSYKMLKLTGVNLKDKKKVEKFYNELDWDELIKKSKPINDSINNIKKIVESNLYDISILTHVNSQSEIEVKEKFIKKYLKNIDTIYVSKLYDKCDVVDCYNTVLVDDFMGNLEKWSKKGGIPIKFSTTGKEYDCISINNLGMLIEKYNDIKNKLYKQ